MSRGVLIGVACALLLPCRTFGDEFQSVRERIRAYVDQEGIPSVAVAAVRRSDIVCLEAFGWADVEVIANAFFGASSGQLKPSASRLPEQERIIWDLRLLNDRLQGVLYVNCGSEGNGYLLPFWVKLKRAEQDTTDLNP